jgi:methyl-accepting chemotaxis protein
MKNWSLSKKVWFVIGILSLAFVASSAFCIYSLIEGRQTLNEITQTLFKRNKLVEEISDNQRLIVNLSMENILKTDEATIKRLNKDFSQVLKKMESDVSTYKAIASPEGKALLEKYLVQYEIFLEASKNAQVLGTQNKNAEAMEMLFSVDENRKEMRRIIEELTTLTSTRVDKLANSASDSALIAITLSCVIAGVSIAVSLLVAYFTLQAVTRAIAEIVRNLSDSSIQVSSAASQIASSAEELSRATTEQAASLEETSASVEELNSMIARNTENAKSAEEISGQSQKTVVQGQDVIRKMMESMEAINLSSEGMAETVKVIEQIDKKTKVINEIVNKTELLSFNASVEAARAGEHGKGFAVVAEEVGNLARMSGSAAEEIAVLLEESIRKVNQMVEDTKRNVEVGAQVARDCGSVFEEVIGNVSSVSGKATEIASASDEQARGCSEITKAMSQLDQMTQQNAATSEECAASAEELSAQADTLKGAVAHLVRTVNGSEGQSHAMEHSSQLATPRTAMSGPAAIRTAQTVVQLKSPQRPSKNSMETSMKKAAGAPHYEHEGFKNI